MEIIFTLIPIVCVLISIGILFALPMYIPAIKDIARHTALRRQLAMTIIGSFTFIVCLSGVAYLDAIITNGFSESISGVENPFITNSHQDNLLLRELWLQNLVMPSVRADCYTNDVIVCKVANSIEANLNMNTKTEYLILLAHGLIATMSNIMMVNHILHDNRKKKSPTVIIG